MAKIQTACCVFRFRNSALDPAPFISSCSGQHRTRTTSLFAVFRCLAASRLRQISALSIPGLTLKLYLYRYIAMLRRRSPSPQTAAVLLALAGDPAAWRYGYDLCQELELKAGTLYPILMRLADRGLLETAWESDAPRGRPPRHMYRLTGEGCKMAAELKRAHPLPRSKQFGFRPLPEGI